MPVFPKTAITTGFFGLQLNHRNYLQKIHNLNQVALRWGEVHDVPAREVGEMQDGPARVAGDNPNDFAREVGAIIDGFAMDAVAEVYDGLVREEMEKEHDHFAKDELVEEHDFAMEVGKAAEAQEGTNRRNYRLLQRALPTHCSMHQASGEYPTWWIV